MRRLTLFLAAALLVAGADSASGQMVKAGVQGGLNIATADVKGDFFTEDVGTRTGMHLGITAWVDLTKYFAVRADAMYSQKGFGKGDGDVSVSVNYIEIPLYFVFQIPATVKPYLLFGVVLGLESSCNVSTASETNVPCADVSSAPQTKGADSGLVFGLGAETKFGPGFIFADAIFNYGLTDVSEPSLEIKSITTRTFYLSLGYTFNICQTIQ
jgi:hypothetical protein